MKTFNQGNLPSNNLTVLVARSLLVAGFLGLLAKARAQSSPPPVLTITPAVSNQFIITITNGLSTVNYDLYWIPALAKLVIEFCDGNDDLEIVQERLVTAKKRVPKKSG